MMGLFPFMSFSCKKSCLFYIFECMGYNLEGGKGVFSWPGNGAFLFTVNWEWTIIFTVNWESAITCELWRHYHYYCEMGLSIYIYCELGKHHLLWTGNGFLLSLWSGKMYILSTCLLKKMFSLASLGISIISQQYSNM